MIKQILEFAKNIGADSLDIRLSPAPGSEQYQVLFQSVKRGRQATAVVTQEAIENTQAEVILDIEIAKALRVAS